MRALSVAAAAAAALAALATPASACCYRPAVVDYGPPVAVGYVFPPPEERASQIYVVNQGPVVSGPGIYTYTNPYVRSFVPPPYPRRGWVHAAPYPYVHHVAHWHCSGCGGVAPVGTRYYPYRHGAYRHHAPY
jgi:hypothetical protein